MHKAPTNPIMMWEIVQLPHPWVVSQTKCKCIAWNNGTAATACKIYILDKKGSPPGSSFSSIKNKLYFEFPIFNRKASLSNAENKTFPAEFPESVLNKPSGKDPPKGWRCAVPQSRFVLSHSNHGPFADLSKPYTFALLENAFNKTHN